MYKVFVEYRIQSIARESYITFMQQMGKCYRQMTIYEGTDQPNLFVECWSGVNFEQYEELKRLRIDQKSEWTEMNDWVVGGADKIHIWHFSHINL